MLMMVWVHLGIYPYLCALLCSRFHFKFWSSSILQGYSFGPLLPHRLCISPLSCNISVFSPRYANAISLFTSPSLSHWLIDKNMCCQRRWRTSIHNNFICISIYISTPTMEHSNSLLRPHKLVSPVRSHGLFNVHPRKCTKNITIIKLYGY